MKFPRRSLAAALAVVTAVAGLTAACSDSLIDVRSAEARGNYLLRTVNAQPLPVLMSDVGGKRVDLVHAELTISASTFGQLLTFLYTVSAQTTERQSLSEGEVSVEG